MSFRSSVGKLLLKKGQKTIIIFIKAYIPVTVGSEVSHHRRLNRKWTFPQMTRRCVTLCD